VSAIVCAPAVTVPADGVHGQRGGGSLRQPCQAIIGVAPLTLADHFFTRDERLSPFAIVSMTILIVRITILIA
jgi:hypothetical protein